MILKPNDVDPKLKVVAYFNLAPDRKSWDLRKIPEFQFMLIVHGNFEYSTDGRKYFLHPGDIICIFPEQIHSLTRITDINQKATLCGLRFDPFPDLSYTANEYKFKIPPTPIARPSDNSDIHDIFYKCVKLFRNNDSKYTEELLSTLLKELWIRLSEYWENEGNAPLSSRTRKMLEFIDKNLLTRISRKDVAKEFNVSPEYLNFIFKKELNTSPVQYINRQRIYRAYDYLMTEACSVKECAYKMGFDNEFYFSRLFKKVTGHSPKQIMK